MGAFGSARRGVTVARPGQRRWGTLISSVPRGLTFSSTEPSNTPENFHWGAGVVLTGESCGDFQVAAIECEATSFTGDGAWGDPVEFDPIVVWASRVCAAMSGRGDEVIPAAMRLVDEQIGFALAQELYSGTVSGNPAIRKDPTVIAGTAVALDDLMCSLDEAIVAVVGNLEATIHVPAGLLNRLFASDAVFLVDGVYRTPSGHLVIGDGAYDGSAPIVDGTPMEAPAAGEGYVYVTGPIAWDYGPEMDFDPADVGDGYNRTNRVRGQAQRAAIALFDPTCLHLALLADVC